MPRWNAKAKKALCNLFDEGIADPKSKSSDEIDEVMELAPEFEGMTPKRFRDNFKSCATEYLTAQAVTGIRRSELHFHSFLLLFLY